MALYKEVPQENGIILTYHRILYLMQTVNERTAIAVKSYIDDNFREQEKEAIITQPYSVAVTYETDYIENMTVEKAYEYLKTLPQFEGATDI